MSIGTDKCELIVAYLDDLVWRVAVDWRSLVLAQETREHPIPWLERIRTCVLMSISIALDVALALRVVRSRILVDVFVAGSTAEIRKTTRRCT